MQLLPISSKPSHLTTDQLDALVNDVVASTQDLYSRRGFVEPWIGYLATDNGICLGTCAFVAPPVSDEVEIAYYTFPPHQGKGVATRMAGELVRIAHLHSPQVNVIAHTMPEESPSTSVLRRAGFRLLGDLQHPEDGTVWKWGLPGSNTGRAVRRNKAQK